MAIPQAMQQGSGKKQSSMNQQLKSSQHDLQNINLRKNMS